MSHPSLVEDAAHGGLLYPFGVSEFFFFYLPLKNGMESASNREIEDVWMSNGLYCYWHCLGPYYYYPPRQRMVIK